MSFVMGNAYLNAQFKFVSEGITLNKGRYDECHDLPDKDGRRKTASFPGYRGRKRGGDRPGGCLPLDGKNFQGCADRPSAVASQEQLVAEKLKEGFHVTEFTEIPENTVDVYDKAKWHFSQNFPEGLDDFQGYVHTGMYLGWLIDKGLVSETFRRDHDDKIEQFRSRQLTGAQLFESCCDL